MKPSYSIFFHNYYGDHDFWINFFEEKLQFATILYYNIVTDSIYNFELEKNKVFADFKIKKNIQKIIFRYSPNKGKDIGGKLILLDAYLRLNLETDYGLFFHDKKSPYKVGSEVWSHNLFKIAEPSFFQKAIKLFENNSNVGIIAAKGNLKNEWNIDTKTFISNNNLLLTQLQNQFKIFPRNYQYVAGTMFWVKMQPLTIFFNNFAPLLIRELLEKGNVSDESFGTYTHCWERLFCWIVSMQNFKIKTVEC